MKKSTIFLIYILLVSLAASEKKVCTENGYVCAGNKNDKILIIFMNNKKNNDTTVLYGHPLGASIPDKWINDSLLLFETGCCEGLWYFTYNHKSKEIIYYKNNKIKGLDLINKSGKISDSFGYDSLYRYLYNNFQKVQIKSDSIMVGL